MKIRALLVICCILAITSYGFGARLFSDDFEGHAIGDLADGTAAPIGSWSITLAGVNNDEGTVKVINDPTGSGRGQVMEVYDPAIDGWKNTAEGDFSSTTSSRTVIKLDFYLVDDAIAGTGDVSMLRVGPDYTVYNKWKQYYQDSGTYGTGGWSQNLGTGDGTTNVFNYHSETWYTVMIKLAPATTDVDTVTYYITDDTGAVVADNVTCNQLSNYDYYSYIAITSVSGSDLNHNYVDNIEAYEVPDGDANWDGVVDVADLGILNANYGTTSGATWEQGDFNGDGAVDVADLGILNSHYGEGSAPASIPNVPEPTTVGFILFGLSGLVRRKYA